MKRKMIAVGALLAVLLAGGYAVQADPVGMGAGGPQADEGGHHGCRTRMQGPEGERHLDKMAVVLGLSANQRQEIEAIMAAQRESTAQLREQIAAGRKELQAAAHNGDFDEAKVQALADAQAKLMSGMMVSRVREKSQIFALLTPEQQEKAEQLGDFCALGPDGGGPGCRVPAEGPRGGCRNRPLPEEGSEEGAI